jgi:hypothetical protein
MKGQVPGSLGVQRAAGCDRAAGVDRREESLRTGKGPNDHTADAYVKLLIVEPTTAKAWKKLEENFEKKSNARVIQLRKKLTSMKLMGKQTIAKYLGKICEIKVDPEAAGQVVLDMELAVHALNALPVEYATPVEILEMGETELNLDAIQPKLMQREQKLKLQAEIGAAEEELADSEAQCVVAAYVAKMGGSSKAKDEHI